MNLDFVGISQVASFAPGGPDITSVTFTVADDDEPEMEETYYFKMIVIGSDATVTVPNIATVRILANDDAFGFFRFIDVRSFGVIDLRRVFYAILTLKKQKSLCRF